MPLYCLLEWDGDRDSLRICTEKFQKIMSGAWYLQVFTQLIKNTLFLGTLYFAILSSWSKL